MSSFSVLTQQYAERTVITVAGETDLGPCPELLRAARTVPLGGRTLQLDVSGVSFMDSSGLNLLLQLRRRLLAERGRFLVTGLQNQPTGLLHLTETYDLLTADTDGPLLGFSLPRGRLGAWAAESNPPIVPNAFIRIPPQGKATIIVDKIELGQGVYTSFPMMVCEELELGLDQIEVAPAPPDRYGTPYRSGTTDCAWTRWEP